MKDSRLRQPHKSRTNEQAASTLSVITITQQYGCAGDQIAAQLAARLRWRCVNHEIVDQVAQWLGVTVEEAAQHNLRLYNFVERFLLSMQLSCPETVEALAGQPGLPILPHKQEHLYHQALQRVIEVIADSGRKVIVDHGAQALLAGRPDVLHVQVVAPLASRIHMVMQRERLGQKEALARIQQREREVARYLRLQCRRDVNDPLLYDLTINSNTLDLESQVNMICQAYAQKVTASSKDAVEPVYPFYAITEITSEGYERQPWAANPYSTKAELMLRRW